MDSIYAKCLFCSICLCEVEHVYRHDSQLRGLYSHKQLSYFGFGTIAAHQDVTRRMRPVLKLGRNSRGAISYVNDSFAVLFKSLEVPLRRRESRTRISSPSENNVRIFPLLTRTGLSACIFNITSPVMPLQMGRKSSLPGVVSWKGLHRMDRNLTCSSCGSLFRTNSAPQCNVMPHSRGRDLYVSDVSRS